MWPHIVPSEDHKEQERRTGDRRSTYPIDCAGLAGYVKIRIPGWSSRGTRKPDSTLRKHNTDLVATNSYCSTLNSY